MCQMILSRFLGALNRSHALLPNGLLCNRLRVMPKQTANVMARVRTLYEKSGLSLDELGQKMGYEGDAARKSVWQFLNKTTDPRLSMLQRFADAMGITLVDLVK